MSIKLRFFLFVFSIAIIPAFILGWIRTHMLSTQLRTTELPPEIIESILQNLNESHLILNLIIGIFCSFLTFLLFRSFADPLAALLEAMRRMRERDFSQRIPILSTDEIGELSEVFNEMAEQIRMYVAELEEADRAKDNFLAIMAHELRNPIAPIVTSLEILRLQHIEDQTLLRQISIIHRQTEIMRKLIDYLLDVSRLKHGRIVLEKEKIDLTLVLRESLETILPLLADKEQRLHMSIPQTPIWIEGDQVRLNQVFINLLKNASEHTEERGEIHLGCTTADQHTLVTVRDKGSGIPKESLWEIFTLFARGASAQHKPGGLGVGLYLVKTYIEMHGGKVSVHSEGLGTGAEFVVRLPLISPSP
jgi:signal transduction histidine kinase